MSEANSSESHGRHERPLPAAWTQNPFQAPAAHVEDVRHSGDSSLLAEPQRVAAGRGMAWWSTGWELFREATGLWIGIALTLFVASLVLNFVPFLGLVFYVVFPVLAGGLMLGCRSLDSGGGLSFGHLVAGFQKHFGQLALVGLLYLAGIAVMVVAIFVVGFGGGFGAAMSGGHAGGVAATGAMLGVLVALGLSVPLAMAMWFAPSLVVLNELSAVEAMKLSFRGCWRNMMPFLVFGLAGFVLAIVATIPLGLGWLALMPTMICATYGAYRDIFLA